MKQNNKIGLPPITPKIKNLKSSLRNESKKTLGSSSKSVQFDSLPMMKKAHQKFVNDIVGDQSELIK